MAVYTDVSEDEVAAFVAGYDIGDVLSYKGIAEGVENSNFLLHTQKGYYILTLYEKRVNPQELPFFLGLMEHLSRRNIICPLPVRNRAGQALGALAGRPAALVTFLEGLSLRRPHAAHCQALGKALAQLHLAGADFAHSRRNSLSLSGWQEIYSRVAGRAGHVHLDIEGIIGAELAALEPAWPSDLPTGIIHADLFPDNVFFLESQVSGLIDFYFACTDMWAYDLAICLNAWCFEADSSFNLTKGQALLAGYQEGRVLSPDELRALPVLARGAALRFLLTRLVDWLNVPEGALVKPKDPMEYFKKLRFHQRVRSAREYGAL